MWNSRYALTTHCGQVRYNKWKWSPNNQIYHRKTINE
jgi:hypothetical protein